MPSWNDASFLDADQALLAFANMFVSAALERAAQSISLGLIPFINNDDMQLASFVQTLQGLVTGGYQYWVDESISIPGITVTTSGYDLTQIVYQTVGDLFESVGLDRLHGFERRKPREISSTSATVDEDGNTATTGQRAYLIPAGGLHICVTSGNWIREFASGAAVDILNNYSLAPNHAADIFELTGPEDTPIMAATGRMQVGDYYGKWIWEQIRNIYNKMVVTPMSVGTVGANDGMEQDAEGYGHTFADALTSGHTNYAAATPVAFTGIPYAQAIGMYTPDSGTGEYTVYFRRQTGQFDAISPSGFPPPSARTIKIYVAGAKLTTGSQVDTYDDNGDGINEDQYTLIDTIPLTTDTNPRGSLHGSLVRPNDPAAVSIPPGPFDPFQTTRGYAIKAIIAIAHWDVPGGFTYRP